MHIPLPEIPRTVLKAKAKLLDVLNRAARTPSCGRAAEHRSGLVILEYKPARYKQATLLSAPRRKYRRTASTAPMLKRKLRKTNHVSPRRGASAEEPANGRGAI